MSMESSTRWSEDAEGRERTIADLEGRIRVLEDELRLKHGRAEDSLQLMRYMIDQAPDDASLAGPDGRFYYVNDAKCRSLGYTREELLSMHVWDIDPGITKDKWDAAWQYMKRQGFKKFDTWHRTKSGQVFLTEVSVTHFDFHDREYVCAFVRDITERKLAEEALRASEERFHTLADNIPVLAWMADADGRISWFNEQVYDYTGMSLEELQGWGWQKVLHPDYVKSVTTVWRSMIETGQPRDNIFPLRGKDGSYRWFLTRSQPIRNEHGTITRWFGTQTDITERKRAEEALVREKYILTKSQEVAHLGNWALDVEAGEFKGSDENDRIHGYEHGDTRPTREWVLSRVHPEDRAVVADLMEARVREGKRGSIDYRVIRPDGSVRYVNAIVDKAVRDKAGKVKRLYGITQDITERKRAEAELERVNRAIQAISKCNAVVIRAREESALLYEVCRLIVEDGGYRMAWIGYTANDENMNIKPMAKAGLETDYVEKARVTWADTERGRGPVGTAVRTGKSSVTKHVTTDLNFAPWRDAAIEMGYNSVIGLPLLADDKAFGVLTIYSEKPNAFDREEIALLQDMTDNVTHGILSIRNRIRREEAEDALKAAKNDAELYVDLMGHDINNMNQSAQGFLELALQTLEMDGKIGRDGRVLIEKPLQAVQSSSRLISNVRKLQRLADEGVKTRSVDLHDLSEELKLLEFRVGDQDATINFHEVPHYVVEGSDLLRDVFFNLISNAVKHAGPDRPVTIDVKAERVDQDGRAYYRCTVEDDGPGVPDELKPRLFHRFQRGATRAHGKGLGLYLARTLVEGYHGKVWVEDRVRGDSTKGARFVVQLPVVEK